MFEMSHQSFGTKRGHRHYSEVFLPRSASQGDLSNSTVLVFLHPITFFFFLNTVNFINFSSSRSLIFKTWYIPSSGYHKLLYINLDDESFFYCWIFACKTDFASNFAKCFLSQYYCTAISEHENIYWKFVV